MKRSTFHLSVFFIAFLIVNSCTSQPADISNEIMEANQKFMEAFNASDANAVTMCYTTDAKLFPTNSDIIEGHDAINKFWGGAMSMGVKKAVLETTSATGYGNIAIEEGKYSLYADKDQVIDEGKYIVTWEKINGEWKLKRDIWNTNHPSISPKYDASEENYRALFAASINFAKSKKVTPAELGKYIGKLHAEGWQPDSEDHLQYFMSGYNWNMDLFKYSQVEIVEQSDSFVKAKTKLDWTGFATEEDWYGVNSAQMNDWLEQVWIAIANHLDLIYTQEIDGDWIFFTVTKK
jgi:ketosteroid isomerase-like protein